jgi:hypothetical protein
MNQFIESMKRLYLNGMIKEEKILELFLNGKISEEEKNYILSA